MKMGCEACAVLEQVCIFYGFDQSWIYIGVYLLFNVSIKKRWSFIFFCHICWDIKANRIIEAYWKNNGGMEKIDLWYW